SQSVAQGTGIARHADSSNAASQNHKERTCRHDVCGSGRSASSPLRTSSGRPGPADVNLSFTVSPERQLQRAEFRATPDEFAKQELRRFLCYLRLARLWGLVCFVRHWLSRLLPVQAALSSAISV